MNDKFYSVKVKQVVDESLDSKSFYFDVSNGVAEHFKYKQGQHVYVKTIIDGMEHFRPYSITSAPSEDVFKLTVKRYRGGIVSNYLNDTVKSGEKVEMMPPQGEFFTELNESNSNQYYFIGAGSGISPLLSLIKETLNKEPSSLVYLYYGNRNEDSIIFNKELEELQKKHSSRLKIEYILSAPKKHRKPGLMGFLRSPEIKWKGSVGHIDGNTLKDFFGKYPIKSRDDMKIFICGPDGMIHSTQHFFSKNGVPSKNILTESFNREFENILPGGVIDHCKTSVTYKGEKYEVDLNDQRPILDSLLKKELIIPFACRSGLCSACMTKVISGEVNCRETKGMPKELRDLGYVLSCQSTPATNELEIDYDSKPPTLT